MSAPTPAPDLASARGRLESALRDADPAVVAVSGGVDSLTLAAFAAGLEGAAFEAAHAVSPAVPPSATRRVREFALARGLALTVLDAGEFSDESYRENPANRCYFCKSHLYDALRRRFGRTLLSGANLDDLDDFRPGLIAAREREVRHPFVEAGFTKARVRELARALGLGDVAELPAAPCLSSRVETGIRIEAATLGLIDAIERELRAAIGAATVRCRVRRRGVVIELDQDALDRLDDDARSRFSASVAERASRAGLPGEVAFAPYVQGSAFLRPPVR